MDYDASQFSLLILLLPCFFLFYFVKSLFRLNPDLFNLCILYQALESRFGIEIIFFLQINIPQE